MNADYRRADIKMPLRRLRDAWNVPRCRAPILAYSTSSIEALAMRMAIGSAAVVLDTSHDCIWYIGVLSRFEIAIFIAAAADGYRPAMS